MYKIMLIFLNVVPIFKTLKGTITMYVLWGKAIRLLQYIYLKAWSEFFHVVNYLTKSFLVPLKTV